MKIVLIGATGTLGLAVEKELSPRHELIRVGHSKGDFTVDIKDTSAIEKMFKTIGAFDALISTVGKVHFGELAQMTADQFNIGLQDKLMGQVNLVLIGQRYINDLGSFTLTSGILSHDPIRLGSSAAMVNAAVDGFVKGAAIELSRGLRINSVSPTVIAESLDKYGDFFRGFAPVPAKEAALLYSKSVEGLQTGRTYKAGY